MGPPLQALGAFEGQQVPVTPLIGKLHLHIQNYLDSEDFFISPLVHQDVILGMPWFHRLYAKIQFPKKIVSFTHNGREISIKAQHKGNTIPIVTSDSAKKVIKKSLFAYMIHVKDSQSLYVNENSVDVAISSQVVNNHNGVNDTNHLNEFLHSYSSCFADKIPNELPPSRGEDDHRIDLIQGSTPPNRVPYRVSLAQQE